MAAMQITFVAPFGWQPKGTVRVRAFPIARALVERGHSVTLLIPPWDDPAAAGKKWLIDGVHIVNLPLSAGPLPLQLSRLLAATLGAINAAPPDVVHVFKPKGISGAVVQALRLAEQTRRRTGAVGHSPQLAVDTDDWEGPGGWNDAAGYPLPARLLFALQEPAVLQAADCVTVASHELARLMSSHVGLDPERIVYVPNSADDRAFGVRPDQVEAISRRLNLGDAPVLLLTTRFFEFDPAVVARAWSVIRSELPAARLLVVGDALRGEDQAFRAELEKHRAEDGVVFTGWVQPDELGAIYRIATAALMPARDTLINRTRCSVKLVETVAAGLPVVAERVGQAAEYVRHGSTGFTVAPGDVTALAAAALTLLRFPDLARRYGAAGSRLIRDQLSWSRIVAPVERAYGVSAASVRALG